MTGIRPFPSKAEINQKFTSCQDDRQGQLHTHTGTAEVFVWETKEKRFKFWIMSYFVSFFSEMIWRNTLTVAKYQNKDLIDLLH